MSTQLSTFSADEAVELGTVDRNGFVESRHIGSAVVTAPDGSIALSLGNPSAPVYPRSTLKPFQALASLQAGAPMVGAQVAIASGSHVGSLEHMDLVESMLSAAGLTEENLQCPAAWPQDSQARAWMIRTDRSQRRVAMNCSGKHAGFVWACAKNGWDLASYLNPQHPLQRLALSLIEQYAGEEIVHLGVDGCGAPVPAISLTGLSRAYGALGHAPSDHSSDARLATISTAMRDYPWAVEGVGKPNTVTMEDLGIVAKLGAEGVLGMGTDDGYGVAVKVLDGSQRVATLVGLSLLVAVGQIDDGAAGAALKKFVEPITGGGAEVGMVRLGSPVLELLNWA